MISQDTGTNRTPPPFDISPIKDGLLTVKSRDAQFDLPVDCSVEEFDGAFAQFRNEILLKQDPSAREAISAQIETVREAARGKLFKSRMVEFVADTVTGYLSIPAMFYVGLAGTGVVDLSRFLSKPWEATIAVGVMSVIAVAGVRSLVTASRSLAKVRSFFPKQAADASDGNVASNATPEEGVKS